jgi:hypothetical protein
MGTPLFQGELVDDSQTGKPSFSGEPVEEIKETTKPKTATDRFKQFGEAVTGGTLLGAATPELTMAAGKGIAMIPNPYAKATGYGMDARRTWNSCWGWSHRRRYR